MSILNIDKLSILDIEPFSVQVKADEIVCLTGASGSGKSMLLKAVVDLIPHQGDVELDGLRCSQTRPALWRRRVGFLAAETLWWSDKVGDHFNRENEVDVTQLGFPTEVMQWSVARLSSGEKQRLGLLRLLANQPKALLLDEPTASLDPESVKRVEALIKTYQAQHRAPVLWVSHDPAQIKRIATRVLHLEHHRVEVAA